MLTANAGIPNRKLIVPSSGSTTQRSSPSPVSPPSSPRIASPGRRSPSTDRIADSAARSASETRSVGPLLARTPRARRRTARAARPPRPPPPHGPPRAAPAHRSRSSNRVLSDVPSCDHPGPMRPAETIAGARGLHRPRRRERTPNGGRRGGWPASSPATAATAVRIETFWCRPNWALAHAWHVALALVGSLVVGQPPGDRRRAPARRRAGRRRDRRRHRRRSRPGAA